ncbi:3-oxosteroid 1-dehydrogenase [Delftia tsuruhatensis]|uniref:FAD-dependent oxidoreductase n=1 Tax=Delftia tsuruhatensis TaxID=180282 RepID=UPI001E73709C|nr:FAD-dependent oxidoreductase [Delftia tsuruhatensis]CAB5671400.1 3-oxosteroid 1-dehydrogenase [Delftia tsuruhatensis]CAC9683213.1 3-oxosteroid 1-dehydrogenase [Delftia tsuruhatensis]
MFNPAEKFDVIVVGSGASGLTAALTAARLGAKVCLLERDAVLGGTTALSGGWMWIPNNHLARELGRADSLEDARAYLQAECGAYFDEARVEAFLRHGPRMLEYLAREVGIELLLGEFPDYHPLVAGSSAGARSLCAAPFDAKQLGTDRKLLRPPLRTMTLFGLPVMAGKDLHHFYNATRSWRSASYVVQRLLRYGHDLLRYGANTRLVNGTALVAHLYRAARAAGVDIRVSTPVTGLVQEASRVSGVRVAGQAGTLLAERGVILACGGFSHDANRRQLLYPHERMTPGHYSPVPASIDGAGMRLAVEASGVLEDNYPHAAAWAPVSLVPQGDGGTELFVHFVDRPKPGFIAVTRAGHRFVNEANSYHDFIAALLSLSPEPGTEAFLLCDHPTLRKYGMGAVKPAPFPIRKWLRNGYLQQANTLGELARRLGIDGAALDDTVQHYNLGAIEGRDRQFGKGENVYNRYLGDPQHQPNPNVGPLRTPPYYAVRLVPGDLGTYATLRTDARARVLRAEGTAVDGLYAVGNDMASIMGGAYPGPGITLGPGMTFGFIAAHDAITPDPH